MNIRETTLRPTLIKEVEGKLDKLLFDNFKEEINETIDVQKDDYMYQTPTIEGTQIQLTKKSNTDRLYFKLDKDVTGNITISTDGGVIEKNLIDIDGVQVTYLEKGFVEVVAHANFFILRNRGMSSEDRQALIDVVNAGLRNESDLKTSVISALNTVNTEGDKIQEGTLWGDVLNSIPDVKTGKKWASGISELSMGTTRCYNGMWEDYFNMYMLEVSGLNFEPSRITIQKTGDDNFYWVYDKNSESPTYKIISVEGMRLGSKFTLNNGYVNGQGFKLPVTRNKGVPFKWTAYE